MLFTQDVTIPPNTPKENPHKETIKITKGNVKRLGCYLPWGCAGLVGIQIIHYTWQLAPLSRGEYMIGNDYNHSYVYNYDIIQEPFELVIVGYNLDDTYSHTPFIFVEMSSGELSANLEKLLRVL